MNIAYRQTSDISEYLDTASVCNISPMSDPHEISSCNFFTLPTRVVTIIIIKDIPLREHVQISVGNPIMGNGPD